MSLSTEWIFIEEQKFDNKKLRYIAILLSVFFGAGFAWAIAMPFMAATKVIGYASFFGCAVMFFVDFFVFVTSLNIKIDEEGIFFKENPSKVEGLCKWEQIDGIRVRYYKYGISSFKGGPAYSLKGKTGIQIIFNNGQKLQIGIQNINEAKRVIEHYLKKEITAFKS